MYPRTKPPWRFAATLVIAARSQTPAAKLPFNYKLLLMRRSAQSRFMPSLYVFPGGVVSNHDFSERWTKLFQKSGYEINDLRTEFHSQNRPNILDSRYYPESSLSTDLALRICAIRETFEESGFLVARRAKNGSRLFFQDSQDGCRQSWRKEVHENADRFVDMCEDMDILPDIWSLSEWSNWLTPLGNKASRRYDTIFYICTPEQSVESMNVVQDDKEMENAQWLSPAEALVGVANKSLSLAPPQTYEVLRLAQFRTQHELENHHRGRAREGLQLIFPVRYEVEDGVITALPGDSLYPDRPNFCTPQERDRLSGTVDQRRHLDPYHHRFEVVTDGPKSLRCNITRPYGLATPMDFANIGQIFHVESDL